MSEVGGRSDREDGSQVIPTPDTPLLRQGLAWASPDGGFYCYRIYGICLRSHIQFSFDETTSTQPPDVELLTAPRDFFHSATRTAVIKPTPSRWYQYSQLESGQSYLLWEGLFEFLIEADGRRIWCGWLGAPSLETLQVYLLGHALSFALVKQGLEPLHSTAVVIDGQAIAFMGDSGFGKSTLAAAFLAQGHRLLTDDLLLLSKTINGYDGQPGPPRLKLFPKVATRFLNSADRTAPMNGETEKLVLPIAADRHQGSSAPLRVIYVLSGPRDVFRKQHIQVTALSPREAFVELIRNTFNSLVTDSGRLRRQYSDSLQLVANMPIKRIAYPRVLATLPDVRDTILGDLDSELRRAQ
jgi:hypothetical protein